MTHPGWLETRFDVSGMQSGSITLVIAGASTADLARSRMAVPADARVNADRIEWIAGTGTDPTFWREGERASSALWAFIKLAVEPDADRFADFARRYGVLALSPAGLPAVSPHAERYNVLAQTGESWQGFAVSWEWIAAWRVYAANARAVVHLASALRGNSRINATRIVEAAGLEDDAFKSEFPYPEWGNEEMASDHFMNLTMRRPSTLAFNLDRPEHTLATQRQWLAWWVTKDWIGHSALIPTITWNADRPQLCLPIGRPPAGSHESHWPPNTLFNILAAHLAAFICSGEPVAQCSRCGELHPRTRVPRADQPTYCNGCKPIADRQRKREHAAKRRRRERVG